jgi:hypothetical protein
MLCVAEEPFGKATHKEMFVMQSQPVSPDRDRSKRRSALFALLAIVTLVASLWSVQACTNWIVAVAVVFAAVTLGGVAGALAAGRDCGNGPRAAYAVGFALIAAAVAAIFFLGASYIRQSAVKDHPRTTARTHSPEELLKAVQLLVPSARSIPEGPHIEEVLSGHYEEHGDTAGTEFFFFPDKTYFYVLWADIIPRTIWEDGTWEYRQGLIAIHSQRRLCDWGGPLDDLYLPLMTQVEEPLKSNGERKQCDLLLGCDDAYKSFLIFESDFLLLPEADRLSRGRVALSSSYMRTEPISATEIDAIKEKLRSMPQLFDRLSDPMLSDIAVAMGFVMIIEALAVVFVRLRRNRRQTAVPSRGQPP